MGLITAPLIPICGSDMSQSEDASHVSPELLTSLLIHTSRLPNCILRRGNLKSEPSFSKRFHISQSGGFPSVSVIRKWRKTLCRCECNVWCRNVDVNVLSICVTIPTLWRWIIFLNSRIENLLSVSKGSLKISRFIQCIFNCFLTYPENVSSLLDPDMNLRCWLGLRCSYMCSIHHQSSKKLSQKQSQESYISNITHLYHIASKENG